MVQVFGSFEQVLLARLAVDLDGGRTVLVEFARGELRRPDCQDSLRRTRREERQATLSLPPRRRRRWGRTMRGRSWERERVPALGANDASRLAEGANSD